MPAKSTSFTTKANEKWGKALPEYVASIAREADRLGNLNAVAKKLKTSASNLSGLIGKTHPSIGKASPALKKIEEAVRGVLMNETLRCPALGMEIGRGDCVSYQGQVGNTSSPDSFRLKRECPKCPNFIGGKS